MTAPVAHAAKTSAQAPSATAAQRERRSRRPGAARTPASSGGGAPASAGLEPGMGSPGWGIERAEAMRASDARTTETRSILTAALLLRDGGFRRQSLQVRGHGSTA